MGGDGGDVQDASDGSLRLEIYRTMRLVRRTEERLLAEYHPADEMRCPMHFCIGQEALYGALSVLLRDEDTVMCPHRSHGFYLAKKAPLDAMVAEFYGKRTGASGGMAGSQELSHGPCHFYSGAVLGGAFSIGAGAAFAAKYLDSTAICVAAIGDGGMEEGIVFETLNIAAVHRLPVLLLCENNLYSAHTPFEPWRSRNRNLTHRAEAFGVSATLLDGYDPLGLCQGLAEIIDRLRKGEGPAFVEVQTYRTCSHVGPESDEWLEYRSAEELESWRRRDPLPLMRQSVLEAGVSEERIIAMETALDVQIEAAIAAAKAAPFPEIDEAMSHNWDNTHSPLITAWVEGAVADFDPSQSETKLKAY